MDGSLSLSVSVSSSAGELGRFLGSFFVLGSLSSAAAGRSHFPLQLPIGSFGWESTTRKPRPARPLARDHLLHRQSSRTHHASCLWACWAAGCSESELTPKEKLFFFALPFYLIIRRKKFKSILHQRLIQFTFLTISVDPIYFLTKFVLFLISIGTRFFPLYCACLYCLLSPHKV